MGEAWIGYFARTAAFSRFSVLIESQTNRPACRPSALSVKTKALMERQECHQGAQVSRKIGFFSARASARALG